MQRSHHRSAGRRRPILGLLFATLCLAAVSGPGPAQVPATFAYQGVLNSSAGVPQNGTFALTIRLYDAASGGTLLHTEAFPAVNVVNGQFSVLVGSTNAFAAGPDIVTFDRPLFLSVQVGADAEMSPRLALGSAPFSLAAAAAGSTATVNCSQGGNAADIEAAIAGAPVGQRVTVNIVGNCGGNIVIHRNNVTLAGAGTGTITGTSPHADPQLNAVVTLAGAVRVFIDGLTIQDPAGDNDMRGLLLFDNANALVSNGSVIRNHDGPGILMVENSTLDLSGSTVRDNRNIGVLVHSGSHVDTTSDVLIEGNLDSGMLLQLGASATIRDTIIRQNGDANEPNSYHALFVFEGSHARIEGGSILTTEFAGTNGVGIGVNRSSSVRVRGTNTIGSTVPADSSLCPDNCNPFSAGGVALDVQFGSTFRQDGGKTTFNGHVYTFNLSTIDIRDAVINGTVQADGLSSNVRLRDQSPGDGPTVIGNVVLQGTSELSIRTASSPDRAVIDGNVVCRNRFGAPSNIAFQDPSDGYVNCP